MQLNSTDFIVISIYFLLLIVISFFANRKKDNQSKDEYILAGRKLTLPLFVATIVATWYGSILGVGEFVYSNGIVTWLCFGLPYYIAAILFAFFLSGKIRLDGASTIPEKIHKSYGQKASLISSFIILIITVPAPYLLMLSIIFELYFQMGTLSSLIFSALITILILSKGGLKSDIYANAFQFILMYIGFATLLFFSFVNLGDFNELFAKLPKEHLQPLGNLGLQYVAVWYIIAMQTFVDPSFHQRCAAVKDSKSAKKGILISVIFWIIFDFLTLFSGLYAKAYLNIENPLMAFPLLGESVLTGIWHSLFIVSLLAIIMSTLESYFFLSSVTIANDIFANRFKELSDIKKVRIGMIITALLSILFAYYVPSVIDIIYLSASVAIPGLLLPLVLSYSKYKITSKEALTIMISSSSAALSLIILKHIEYSNSFFAYLMQIEPMILGIFVSLFLFTIIKLRK